jgi:hypothetical protein
MLRLCQHKYGNVMTWPQITFAWAPNTKGRFVVFQPSRGRLLVALSLSLLVLAMGAAAAPAAFAAGPPCNEVPVTVANTDDSSVDVDGDDLITPY